MYCRRDVSSYALKIRTEREDFVWGRRGVCPFNHDGSIREEPRPQNKYKFNVTESTVCCELVWPSGKALGW